MLSSRLFTQETRFLGLKTPLDPDALLLESFEGEEAISSTSTFSLNLLAQPQFEAEIQAERIVGESMTVSMRTPDGEVRPLNGLVRSFTKGLADEFFVSYRAELVSWSWLLSKQSHSRIFQGLSALDVVSRVFEEMREHFPSLVSFRDDTIESYEPMDYCVQYQETDLDFVHRLLEREGIYYYFEHEEGRHTLVLVDDPVSLNPCRSDAEARYLPESGEGFMEETGVTALRVSHELRAGRASVTDFQFQLANKRLQFDERSVVDVGGNDALELHVHDGDMMGRYNEPNARLESVEVEGARVARLAMQREECLHEITTGESTCIGFAPGFLFRLTDLTGREVVESHMLLRVRYLAHQSPGFRGLDGREAAAQSTFENRFTAIPKRVPYRPTRRTPKPSIHGLQTAFVVGKKGEEIWTDVYGRVKVQFHWDREGQFDEESSCWVRVAHAGAGSQWGAHYLPRIGQEVVVSFLGGDPDRPVVVGCLYNSTHMPPYELPEHQTRSGVKTRSTKEGTGDNFNELRFEDKSGEEEIYLHAERDLNEVVERNHTMTIVEGTQTVSVQGGANHTVKAGSHTVDVSGGDYSVTTTGVAMIHGKSGAVVVGDSAGVNVTGNGEGVNISGNGGTGVFAHGTPNIVAKGDTNATLEAGSKATVKGGSKVAIASPDIILGDAKVTINGTTVKIDAASITLSAGGSVIEMGSGGITISAAVIKQNC